MKNKQKISSKKSSIHWILARRLALTAFIISVVLGVAVFISERDNVAEIVRYRALQGAMRFNARASYLLDIPGLPDRKGIQRELEEFGKHSLKQGIGKFVFVRIFDTDSVIVAKRVDDGFTDIKKIEKHIETSVMKFPDKGEDWHKIIRINGTPYIRIGIPLNNSNGNVVAYADGIFALSSEVIANSRRKVLRTMLIVISIVLLTTGLLYHVIIKLMNRLTKLSLSLLDSQMEILKVLGSAIAVRDNDTDAHNYRVTLISVRIAETAGLDDRSICSLIKGALLHDVGKVGIPDRILLKPSKLTNDEYEVMRTHVTQGLNIIERSEWLNDAIAVVGCHHEKMDGSGYPKGLREENNPIIARIFVVADVFDALTSKRPYKKPYSFDETMKTIKQGNGTHFDPVIIGDFSKIAKSLYDDIAGRNDDGLKAELEGIIKKYFPGNIDTLLR